MQHYATVIYLRSLNKHLLLGSKKNQKKPEKLNIAVLNFFKQKNLPMASVRKSYISKSVKKYRKLLPCEKFGNIHLYQQTVLLKII